MWLAASAGSSCWRLRNSLRLRNSRLQIRILVNTSPIFPRRN